MTPPTTRMLAEQAALRKDLLAAAGDVVAALRSPALEADCLKDYGVNGWGWKVETPFQP